MKKLVYNVYDVGSPENDAGGSSKSAAAYQDAGPVAAKVFAPHPGGHSCQTTDPDGIRRQAQHAR